MSAASYSSVALVKFSAGLGSGCLFLNIFTASNSVVEYYKRWTGCMQFKRGVVQCAVWPGCILRGAWHVCSCVRCFVLACGQVLCSFVRLFSGFVQCASVVPHFICGLCHCIVVGAQSFSNCLARCGD